MVLMMANRDDVWVEPEKISNASAVQEHLNVPNVSKHFPRTLS